ncbi:F0F1 ATP synthase subunit B [Christiangramia fulva]|uniref:ATP synthase subunit b n=1 Tax=Christiangramia fulva TaxID=2126553 RepID=A0A2R3Z2H5_9FLAO|nr:F0F1 ATP synthase subunit B [Christiangramia fulva]AVR44439.1 F0F1 ATP synthase subunit B [Christiangramia fulva]
MKINWFTVIAQVINFLVLVWLLKRFLYKPILKATDEREKSIVSKLKDASAKKEEAKKERDEFQKKNSTFEQEKKQMMEKAANETKEQSEQMINETRKAVAAMKEKQEKNFRQMEENLKKELAERTSHEVLNISRQVLADLASAELEAQMVKHFIEQLQGMDEAGKQAFLQAYKNISGPLLIRSVFELKPEQQEAIKNAVGQLLNENGEFRFETDEKLAGGIELSADGYKLSWNIASYLDSLQEKISEVLQEQSAEKTEKVEADSPEEKAEPKQIEYGSEGPE